MDRKEAVTLVKELGDRELILPTFVTINRADIDRFKVKIKGVFNCKEIEFFLKERGYVFEANTDGLIISKP